MSFVKNNLLDNEKILYTTKPHWIIFLVPSAFALFAVLSEFLSPDGILTWIFLFLAAFSLIPNAITYLTSEYALTNKRVLVKVGFLNRVSVETLLQRIEGIQVEQSLLGRILGYGTIVICGTGGSRDPFARIYHPLIFRRNVQQQLENVLLAK